MEAGPRANDDFNGPEQDGVGWYQVTQRDGLRCSAAVGYLHPALERPNLTVETDAHVNRLLLDGLRAIGVEVDQRNEVREIRATREVILSAGAYQSPQVLLLSGIGTPADLELVGIPAAHDLPVGAGLQDHVVTWITYTTDEASLLTAETEENVELLQTQGTGPLTSNFAEAGGFFRTSDSLEAPDFQLHLLPILFPDAGAGEILEDGWALSPCLLRPTSSGFVKLRSRVPTAKPRILHNYLLSEEDRAAMVAALRVVRRHRGPAGAEGGQPPRRRGARGGRRREPHRPHRAQLDHALPPGRHLRDGAGRGLRAARARHGGPARRRCLGDADAGAGQHERPDDHGRREGRGHDPRPLAGADPGGRGAGCGLTFAVRPAV